MATVIKFTQQQSGKNPLHKEILEKYAKPGRNPEKAIDDMYGLWEDKNITTVRPVNDDGFMEIVNKFRNKPKPAPPSLEEITKEVETVRAKRYGKAKRQDHN
jgi:hypothetical protein